MNVKFLKIYIFLKVSMAGIKQYIIYRQVNGRENKDISALAKGELMAEESVEALSFYHDENSGMTYFSGIVEAAMKQKVKYTVRLVLHHATGEIRNGNCEDCPAGIYFEILHLLQKVVILL